MNNHGVAFLLQTFSTMEEDQPLYTKHTPRSKLINQYVELWQSKRVGNNECIENFCSLVRN